MRKIVMMLLVLAMTVCGAVGIAACGKDPEPEQNQGQVEQEKDKENEEEKPNQNQGENDKGEGKEEEKGETGSENPTKPGENDPPVTPEPQKPAPVEPEEEEPGKEEPGETQPEPENPAEEESGKEEEPQGDGPGTEGPSLEEPDDESHKQESEKKDPETQKPETEKKDPETEKKDPETEQKPDPEPQPQPDPECEHNWTYTSFYEQDFSSRHVMTCSLCSATKSEPCTFDRNAGEKVEPTCTEDGYTKYTCKVCNQFFKAYGFNPSTGGRKYPKKGHTYTDNTWTHGEGNVHTRTCTVCHAVETQNCQFNVTTTPATCTTGGSTIQTCTVCGNVVKLLNSSAQALGHLYQYTPQGNGQHKVECTREGCDLKSSTVNCEMEVKEIPATCTKDGSKTTGCKFCSNKTVEVLKASGHSYASHHFTSDSNGHYGICDTCGEAKARENHDFSESNLCSKCKYDGLKYGSPKRTPLGTGLIVVSVEKNSVSQSAPKIFLPTKFSGFVIGVISSSAFAGNTNLTEIYIASEGVAIMIEKDAFKDCKNLTTIKYQGTEEQWKKNKYGDALLTEAKIENVKVEYNSQLPKELKSQEVTPAALPAGDTKRFCA